MPLMAIWPDGYYVATGSSYSKLWVFNRSAMLVNASAAAIPITTIPIVTRVADLDGSTPPPPGSPAYAFQTIEPNLITMWRVFIDWNANPPSGYATGPTDITVCDWLPLSCYPQQLGTSQRLQPVYDINYRVAYRNFGSYEAIAFAQGVGAQAPLCASIRWYELRLACAAPPCTSAPTVYQQGTFAPDDQNRFNPSLAMDKLGNIAIGYTKSSASMYPEIWYTGRGPTDPLGTLRGEKCIVGGNCEAQAGAPQTDSQRWGDYTSMSVDPVSDCAFYYTNEYFPSSGQPRRTRVGGFSFRDCFPFPAPGVDNTYVNNLAQGTVYGLDQYLIAGREASATKGGLPTLYHTLLHFDLTTYMPPGATVRDGAMLWLYTDTGQGAPLLSVQRSTTAFDQGIATWTNTGGGATSTPPSPLTVSFPITNGWHSVDVTPLVVDCLQDRGGQCYWRLSEVNETDNISSYVRFLSEDYPAYPPQPYVDVYYTY